MKCCVKGCERFGMHLVTGDSIGGYTYTGGLFLEIEVYLCLTHYGEWQDNNK